MAIEYYKGASGNNNAAGLAQFILQPTSPGIQYPEHPVSGVLARPGMGGAFIVLTWKIQYPSHFTDIHSKLGLLVADYNLVTVRIPNKFRAWANYNGMAWAPFATEEFKYINRGYRDVTLTIVDLAAI